jgi:hypothetical protein
VYKDIKSASPYSLNVWTHLAVTYANAGANTTFYINGVVEASGSTLPVHNVTRTGFFGKDDWGNYVDVLNDEIKLYAKALSSQDVAKDMQNFVSYV